MPSNWKDWKHADRISDSIVDLVNAELKRPDFSPIEIIAGQMLAMMALLRTIEGGPVPQSLLDVQKAITTCLKSMSAEAQHR